jgi:hypothetical protein
VSVQIADRNTIKQTDVGHGHVVVTTWMSDPHCLRPFYVLVRDQTRGTES